MTAVQLIAEVARLGGVLESVGPDKLHYRLPPEGRPLLPEIHRLKPELLRQLGTPLAPKKRTPGGPWTPCPVHGDEHRACWFSGQCGLECTCRLCAAWRRGLGWASEHQPEMIQ